MTRDEIIRVAREAGAVVDVLAMGRHDGVLFTPLELERFARLVAEAEREACARVCDQRKIITPEWQRDQHYNQGASHCAAAIRARSEKGQS